MKKFEATLRAKTMRRVVAVYYLKKVINMVTLKIGLLGLTALAFGSLVHVAAVFNNMPEVSNVSALYEFGASAFFHTGVIVQGVIVALGVLTLWLMRDMFKVAYMVPGMRLSSS